MENVKANKDCVVEKIKSTILKRKQIQADHSVKLKKKGEDDDEYKLKKSVLTKNNSEVRRYPKRQVHIKNYEEPDEPQEDRYIFCDFCQESFLDCCTKCGQLAFLQDTVVEMGAENRAKLTLPKNSVEIKPSTIHGLGIFANAALKKGMKMGPYQGKTSRVESTAGYSWKLRNGQLVDGADEKFSNWMRYVNCARHSIEQNLMAFQYKGELYYRTCRDIQPGQELLVYYGNNFAMNLGIDVKGYFEPKEEIIVENGRYCQFCHIGYRDSSRLDYHIPLCKLNPVNFKEPPDKIFTCRFCAVGITDEDYFRKHEIRCEKKCQKNKENIKRSDIVGRNVKEQSKGRLVGLWEKKFSCSKCKYSTNNSVTLVLHERIHKNKFLFVCNVCHKGFNQNCDQQRHMVKHLDMADHVNFMETQKIYSNNGKKITLMALIKGRHVKMAIYKCGVCKYVTSRGSQLKQHINLKHTRETTFKCRFCSYFSAHTRTLKYHMNSVHLKNTAWLCDKCDYSASRNTTLKMHIKQVHDKIKDHKCGLCDFATSQRSNLKVHVHSVHLNDKKFKCQLCDFATSWKNSLNNHLKALHLKNYKYECTSCSYFSYIRGGLNAHMKTKHRD